MYTVNLSTEVRNGTWRLRVRDAASLHIASTAGRSPCSSQKPRSPAARAARRPPVAGGPLRDRRPCTRTTDGRGLIAERPVVRGPHRQDQRRGAHRHGIEVHAWTVNAAEEMVELLDLGVDGLVTDRPDVLRDVLHARGNWPVSAA
jgi:glycerophosphoryl diester phosphodiesterase